MTTREGSSGSGGGNRRRPSGGTSSARRSGAARPTRSTTPRSSSGQPPTRKRAQPPASRSGQRSGQRSASTRTHDRRTPEQQRRAEQLARRREQDRRRRAEAVARREEERRRREREARRAARTERRRKAAERRRRRGPRTFRFGRPALRLKVALFAMIFVFSLFAGRLIDLQGVDPKAYAAAATKEDTRPVVLPASRGALLDRDGTVLADSVDAVDITADPSQSVNHADALTEILTHRLPGLDATKVRTTLTLPNRKYALVTKQVQPAVWQQISDDMKAQKIGGLYTQANPIREYPAGNVAPNVLGYVGAEGTGLGGLEYQYNARLAGKDGKADYTVDAKGNRIPLAKSQVTDARDGDTAKLTLDADLQWYAQQRIQRAVQSWKAKSGSVITMDVKTGEVLAMATYPTFDSSAAGKADPANLGNRPTSEIYEPGSVEKTVTMAGVSNAGKINRLTVENIPREIHVGGTTIKDFFAHRTPVIQLTAAGVIAKSSNLGAILASRQLSRPAFVKNLYNFGYGKRTALNFPGESKGLLASGSWSELTRDNAAFGQGMSVTAMQITAAVNAIANGGVYMPPRLVQDWIAPDGRATPASSPAPHRAVSAAAARDVSLMMETVTGKGGAAPDAKIPGYRVAGKTGTAQYANPDCGCYRGNTTSFMGFAPADKPRFVTYVVLQLPKVEGGGSTQAAPVFKDVMSYALQKYAVPPTGVPMPKTPLS